MLFNVHAEKSESYSLWWVTRHFTYIGLLDVALILDCQVTVCEGPLSTQTKICEWDCRWRVMLDRCWATGSHLQLPQRAYVCVKIHSGRYLALAIKQVMTSFTCVSDLSFWRICVFEWRLYFGTCKMEIVHWSLSS